VADDDADGFQLGRCQIACCAADASPVVVRVVGVEGDRPARDRWVVATGVVHPGDQDLPELLATSIVEVPPPDDPYE
jgi:uncharacterized membrane protein YcgQ (UPF0703/DUF1980 family)